MDQSQDNRSADDASPRQNETDPWGEFLSESSDELLQLQSTHSPGGNNAGTSDGDRHAGIRIVPLLEPTSPSSPADEFLPGETAAPLPEEPPSLAAPAAPRDGAPPFTRRVSYGRTYESPLVSGLPPGTTQSALPDTSSPLLESPAASSLLRPAPADDERAPLIYPDAPPAPVESIWKAASSVPQDEVPLVAARDDAPLAAPDVSSLIDPEPAAVEHHPLPSALTWGDVPPASAVPDETVPARRSMSRRAPVPQGADSLLLSDVLERLTPVHWSEAVAAVEELCVAIDAGPSDTVLVPDLADVFITPDGLVGVRQGAAGEPDVAALGRALQSLVGTGDTPLPLRLFVTSAVAPDRFASVALFADALSYYALPDRAQLIQALYRRAIERRPAPPVVTPRKQPTVIVPPLAPAAPNRGRTMKTWTMAAAAGIIVGAFAGVWLWSAGLSSRTAVAVTTRKVVPPPAPKRTEDWTPGPILVEGARPAVPPSRSDASRTQTASRAGITTASVPARVESAQGRAPIPSPPLVPLNARPAPATILPQPQPLTAAAAPPTTASAAPSNTTAAAVFSETPVTPPVAKPPVVVDSRIYSAADLDVDEPVLLSTRPILPSPASRRDALVTRTFELLVDHEGKVQSSKLIDGTQVLSDISLPQQLKLLKFRPAAKDGRPVNYRYRLRLTSNPE